MDYDVEYDRILGCWCLHFAGEVICLGADSHLEALAESQVIVDNWCE